MIPHLAEFSNDAPTYSSRLMIVSAIIIVLSIASSIFSTVSLTTFIPLAIAFGEVSFYPITLLAYCICVIRVSLLGVNLLADTQPDRYPPATGIYLDSLCACIALFVYILSVYLYTSILHTVHICYILTLSLILIISVSIHFQTNGAMNQVNKLLIWWESLNMIG